MKTLFTLFSLVVFVSCGTKNEDIHTQWVDDLQGDFSFVDNWSYNENVFVNDFGQLVCDGFCDEILTKMRDKDGRIIDDSLSRYYQLLDTTHYYHTISSEAIFPEWAGTDFANAYRVDDTVKCYTMCNAATHSSLQLVIVNGRCIPQVELNSVSNLDLQIFKVKTGFIKIDEPMWKKGILKAQFEFSFIDSLYLEASLWWKGRLYTEIKEFDNGAI